MECTRKDFLMDEYVNKAIDAGMPPEMVSEVIALCDTAWQAVKKAVQFVSQCIKSQ